MQQINLINPQLLTPQVAFSSRTIAWTLLGVVVIGLALYGWVESQAGLIQAQQDKTQTERDALQAQVDALTQPAEDGQTPQDRRAQAVASETQHIAQLKNLRRALGAAQGEPGFSPRLQALANDRLPGVWLTAIEFSHAGFRLQGRALQPEAIPDYLALLSRQPALKTLSLSGFRIVPPPEPEAGRPVVPGVVFVVNPAPDIL
jgi:Tfp pilus assembly protein PilN